MGANRDWTGHIIRCAILSIVVGGWTELFFPGVGHGVALTVTGFVLYFALTGERYRLVAFLAGGWVVGVGLFAWLLAEDAGGGCDGGVCALGAAFALFVAAIAGVGGGAVAAWGTHIFTTPSEEPHLPEVRTLESLSHRADRG